MLTALKKHSSDLYKVGNFILGTLIAFGVLSVFVDSLHAFLVVYLTIIVPTVIDNTIMRSSDLRTVTSNKQVFLEVIVMSVIGFTTAFLASKVGVWMIPLSLVSVLSVPAVRIFKINRQLKRL